MSAYYNENDVFAARWLRNLISAGHIAPGEVDERSIADVRAGDLVGFRQCHFFAGIGGWSYALRLAGVPDDQPVWTGSCPCQPFSAAGKQEGKADARHLWPVWFPLIRECRPARVLGEQVASAIAFGWLDEAAHDLEAEGYAVASAVLPACSIGAPHRRDRLWLVADSAREQTGLPGQSRQSQYVADSNRERFSERSECHSETRQSGIKTSHRNDTYRRSRIMADSDGSYGHWWSGPLQVGWNCREGQAAGRGNAQRTKWLVKPGLPLLANGVSGRVGQLRGFGNAIVPQVAAEFIKCCPPLGECA